MFCTCKIPLLHVMRYQLMLIPLYGLYGRRHMLLMGGKMTFVFQISLAHMAYFVVFKMSRNSFAVTMNGFAGKCFILPVTR